MAIEQNLFVWQGQAVSTIPRKGEGVSRTWMRIPSRECIGPVNLIPQSTCRRRLGIAVLETTGRASVEIERITY